METPGLVFTSTGDHQWLKNRDGSVATPQWCWEQHVASTDESISAFLNQCHDMYMVADFLRLAALKSSLMKKLAHYLESLSQHISDNSDGLSYENNFEYRAMELVAQGAKRAYTSDGGYEVWHTYRDLYLDFFVQLSPNIFYSPIVTSDMMPDLPSDFWIDLVCAMKSLR